MTDFHSGLTAIVPAAGIGSRMGADCPKQYLTLAGKTILEHTLGCLLSHPAIARVIVALAPHDEWFEQLAVAADPRVLRVEGGSERAYSVLNALHVVEGKWVLVHDAARCLVTPAQIEALMAACTGDAVGGLLALPLPDTLKAATADARVAATLDRSDKWLAQTPQMFRIGMLQHALAQATDLVTDEASAIEAQGHAPLLVPGGAQNFKVTYPDDFALAEAVLARRMQLKEPS